VNAAATWAHLLSHRLWVFGTRTLRFTCNICGAACEQPAAAVLRESAGCAACGSTLRTRAVIHALSLALFGESRVLAAWPERRDLRGVGLSDWDGYARLLAQRCDYTNTYYHAPPFLDITDVPEAMAGRHDFLISSDVFEHVAPPVSRAFEGARRLLKPGGTLVLTVPFVQNVKATREHYPELHDFEIVDGPEGRPRLVNRRRDGGTEQFDDLVFHGGPGETLELRVFAEASLRAHLEAAGFRDIRFHRERVARFGIAWDVPWSVPVTATA
jgi:SAM-dependent methyltransferase